MSSIKWDSCCYYIDGKPQFLISGEFHYFRVPKEAWRNRLEMLKAAGGNCVATYIPWILHEPYEGDIRFGDIPERDLEGFLSLCAELELFVICRPGPYQYSELIYEGLPQWLCENYPGIHAEDINGRAFRSASVSYLHPVFLDKVKKWYERVCPIIAKYTLSKNGPVAFVQYDNEAMGIHLWFGGLDYNRQAMGICRPNGRYVTFLKERFKFIEILNSAYGTRYSAFEQVRPFDGIPRTKEEMRNAKDYQAFYFSVIAQYGGILCDWIKAYGIDCDILHNSANPGMNSFFRETLSLLGERFLLGTDHYYNLSPEWHQNNPTPQHVSSLFVSLEMLRLMGFPPTVMELPAGSAVDWPPASREDLKCYYYSNIALGMKGFNYYIFTGGPNPEGLGQFGDIYDYGAGIGAGGEIRPIYEVQKELGEFLLENSWLAKAERVCDFYIGLDWEQSRSGRYFKEDADFGFSMRQAWDFMTKGLLNSSFHASYSPNLVDLYQEALITKTDKPILITTSAVMAKSVQERLVRLVKNGGRIMLAPILPYLDEDFIPCTILKDFLGGASAEPYTRNYPRINAGTVENIYVNGKLFQSENRPKGAVEICRDTCTGAELGWRKDFERGGKVLWLGMQWIHCMHSHAEMLQVMLNELGCNSQTVICKNPNIWTVLRRFNNNAMLFVMNLYSSSQSTEITIREKGRNEIKLADIKLSPMEVRTFKINN